MFRQPPCTLLFSFSFVLSVFNGVASFDFHAIGDLKYRSPGMMSSSPLVLQVSTFMPLVI
jgi:hypothetical protein